MASPPADAGGRSCCSCSAGVTWFGAYNVALNAGEQQVDAGTAALVVTVGPILIALFAGILLKEGFPRPLLIGIAIAASGVVLISLSTRDESAVDTASTTGVLLCLAAAVLYAIGALAQKPTLTVVTPVMSVWLMCIVGAVVCLPYLPSLVRETGDASRPNIVWLVYLGVFPTAIGFSTWSYALKRLSAGQVASATYLVPAVATLISWVMLDEVPAALAFVGGGLCLVGVAITRYRRRRRSAQQLGHQIPQDDVAVLGEDRLGVELHAAVVRPGQQVHVAGLVGLHADAVGQAGRRAPAPRTCCRSPRSPAGRAP